jgi:phenylacetate-CoA ligase
MKSAILKKLNTALPSGVKRVFGSAARNKLFNNRVLIEQLKELEIMDNEALEVKKEKQFAKLKHTLIHAYEHTRYYKKLFDECGFDAYNFSDVSQMEIIPLLRKADIIENLENLSADNIGSYYESMTGGSSGISLKVLLDNNLVYRERAFIYHFWAKCGYDYRTSKIASFRGGIDFKAKIRKFNPVYNEIQLNPCLINEKTIFKYLSYIKSFKADFLHGHPSAVYSFLKFAQGAKINLKNHFKAVLFISENVYDYQREFIETTLGCKCFAYYGHTERAVFAGQAGAGYEFNDYYGYTEIKGNEKQSIITTGFINPKMPLIRYELDDSIYFHPNSNAIQIEGHRDGILHGKNGEIISAASLYIHNSILDKVANQQFIQEETGKVKMLICPINSLTDDDREAIKNYYQDKLGTAIDIEVEITKDMIFTSRGKMPLIIQNVKENK